MFHPNSSSSPFNSFSKMDELCCFLCNNTFTEPLMLSCGHSFCRLCVQPWLRRATVCPFCRCPTLQPIPNTTITQRVSEFKRINTEKSNFIRSAIRRTFHSSKEAKTLQREALRASQRRPRNVVLPKGTEKKKGEENAEKGVGGQKQQKNTGDTDNLQKGIGQIRNKLAVVKQQHQQMNAADDSASEGCGSAHSFRSATTSSATSLFRRSPSPAQNEFTVLVISSVDSLQKELRSAFSVHLINAQHIELSERNESPTEVIDAIGNAQRVVAIYRIDKSESFERIRKVFEYCSAKTIDTMKEKGKFRVIGLIINQRAREVERKSGQKLADSLGTKFSEIGLTMLEKTFPIWFHCPRPNLASLELSLCSHGGLTGVSPLSLQLPTMARLQRNGTEPISYKESAKDELRPAMGLSGSAIREQQQKKKKEKTTNVEGREKMEEMGGEGKEGKKGKAEKEEGRGGGGATGREGSGCTLM
ncbi:hypothetical protein niasHT_013522 [Heterodera trifolii]|uniref:RING-type domain-containing protein n=1 Tax=Heterodera trifolii TaxID=157864 RepID=A0ABD2LCU8_9BILA